MDWIERMNGAIKYIEENLTNHINYNEAARIACCSVYHFQRMFSFIADIPLSEYIRCRRLTLAAFDFQNSNSKVVEIALKYGYDSPEAFSRAFQNMHGVTPTAARNSGVQLKAYPRISFHILVKGDGEMNYRIEHVKGMKVFGKATKVDYHETKQYEDIKTFVEESINNGVVQSILDAIDAGTFESISNAPVDNSMKPAGLFVVQDNDENSLKFMIAADYPEHGVDEHFEILEIPDATWAVFSMTGKHNSDAELDTITHIWKRLGEWFQISGYEHMPNVPELEKRFRTKDGYLAEVWIPVIKSN
jgi:AraC family transcriptional regulator